MRILAPSLRWLAVAGVVVSVSVTSAAHADPGGEVPATGPTVDAPARTPRATSTWYGWQTLATDGAALALLGLAAASDGSTSKDIFATGAAGTYVLGGPIVHAAHGRWGAAAGSLGLRLGTPVVGTVVGAIAGAGAGSSDWDGISNTLVGMVYGFVIGTGVASAIDSALLSHEKDAPRPKDGEEPKAARTVPVRMIPLVSVTREGGNGQPSGARGLVGVAATF